MTTKYLLEGRVHVGESWDWDYTHVSDRFVACLFDSANEAEDMLWELVNTHGWSEDDLRWREVEQ